MKVNRFIVDGTRAQRTRDQARQAWYARHRQRRFARFLGFDNRAQDPAASPVAGTGRLGRVSTMSTIRA